MPQWRDCSLNDEPISHNGNETTIIKATLNMIFTTQSRQRRHFRPHYKNFDKCQPEVADGAIFGVAKE